MKFKGLGADIAGWPKFKHTDILKEKRRGTKIEYRGKMTPTHLAQPEEHSKCDI